MKNKVLIAMTTGRVAFKKTLDMLAANLSNFGHFNENRIGVLINYDPHFLDVPAEKFFYDGEYARLFDEIIYIGPDDIKSYQTKMRGLGLKTSEIEVLCQIDGFGNKKNLILLCAFLKNYEFALFWDDDEYPAVCLENSGKVTWQQTDVLGAHLSELVAGADVACGFWTGHVFPSVPDIHQIICSRTASKLGGALEIGTETHSKYSFISSEKSFEIRNEIPKKAKEIFAARGGKWVSGGNLSVRLQSALAGVVPPYYTPFDSRGDDTIFSLRLGNAKVMAVPSGAFHDMYLDYPAIPEGEYPTNPGFIPQNYQKYLKRFAAALTAWLAYAPLFIRLSEGTVYHDKFEKMLFLLDEVDRTLFEEFPLLGETLHGHKLAAILSGYGRRVEEQFQELQLCHEAWRHLCREI